MPPRRRGMQFAHATLAGVLTATAENDAQARHKIQRTFGAALLAVILIDIACAFALVVVDCGTEGESSRGRSACVLHELRVGFTFRVVSGGVGDLLLLAVMRGVFTLLLLWLGVHFCRPSTPEDAESTRTELEEPLLPNEDSASPTDTSATQEDEDTSNGTHWWMRYWSTGKNRKEVIKNASLGLLFVGCTFFQVYAGLKVSLYPANDGSLVSKVLMCLTILWVNAAASLFRTILAELTREDGVFLPSVHRHPLFFEANRGLSMHWCDICSQRIKSGGCYRCSLCDFDVCVPCSRRSDATTVGENMLRSDRGVRSEQALDNTSYFARSLRIARPELPLLLISFFLLALSSATKLLLPHFQGRIIDTVIPDADGKVDRSAFTHCIKLYVALMVGQGAVSTLYSAIFTLVSRRLKFTIRNSLCERILSQDVAYFDGT